MARLTPDAPFIHPECEIVDSTFGAFVEISKGSRVQNSTWGDYSYCDRYADIANAEIGKFSNIAAFARIGATDHPLHTASCHHFLYRSDDYWEDAPRDEAFFAHRKSRTARIGHDTWIGAGAMIKPEVLCAPRWRISARGRPKRLWRSTSANPQAAAAPDPPQTMCVRIPQAHPRR